MVECIELYESKGLRNLNVREQILYDTVLKERAERSYLCPDLSDVQLVVRGHWMAEYFEYLSIKVMGCDLGD